MRIEPVEVGGKMIGHGRPTFIVSEIGGMYENLEGMRKLIHLSKVAGADAVKIQTYKAEKLALPGAIFQFEDGSTMSQYEFFKRYEISHENHKILFDYANEIGITLFSTPSHRDDVDFLDSLGVPAFKTGSDDLTNYPFLEYIARRGKPMIVSTGMSTLAEIELAVKTILDTGNDQLILLHSTVSYPPDPEFANLNIIPMLQKAFGLPVGYSDHVFGIFSSVLAGVKGACLIEKHVTLDRSLKRADYQVSLEPDELREMISQLRLIKVLEGSSVKKVYPPEEKWRKNARKSLVAAKDLEVGKRLEIDDIKIMRPGTGIHPQFLPLFLGKMVKKALKKNELLPKDIV